jgi:DNA-binding NtrC family response regulator
VDAVVLVVDDEPELRRVVKQLIERSLPVRVVEAASGEAGLAALAQGGIDLVITDQTMPRMSGVEFLKQVDRIAKGVPRVMLTAEHDLGLAVQAINELRIAAFFPKPLDTTQFIDTIRRILAARSDAKAREEGFNQASRVFQHEATLQGITRPKPFLGSLTEDPEDKR